LNTGMRRFLVVLAAALCLAGLTGAPISGQALGSFETVVQTGHSDSVGSLAAGSDPRLFLSTSRDGTARLWDLWSAREMRSLAVPSSGGPSTTGRGLMLPGNRACVWAGNRVAVYKLEDGSRAGDLDLSSAGELGDAALSPDGRLLAFAAGRGWSVFDSASLAPVASQSDPAADWSIFVSFLPDGKHLAVASGDKRVRVWDIYDRKPVAEFKGHTTQILGLGAGQGGTMVSRDAESVRLWDVQSGLALASMPAGGARGGMAVSPDGKRLAAQVDEDRLGIWDLGSRKVVVNVPLGDETLSSLAFARDGTILLGGMMSGTVLVWDAGDGTLLQRFGKGAFELRIGTADPRGDRLAGTGGQRFLSWNLRTGRPEADVRAPFEFWFSAVSPDASLVALAAAGAKGGIRILDVRTMKTLAKIATKAPYLPFLVFSPDGKSLAYPYTDREIRIADTASGLDRATFAGHTGTVQSVVFSADGTRLYSGGSDLLALGWETATGKRLAAYKYASLAQAGVIQGLALATDGQTLALDVNGERLSLFRTDTAALLWSLPTKPHATASLSFSPDGSSIALGCKDGVVRVVLARDGREARLLTGHNDSVRSIRWLGDGTRLASSGRDGRCRIWDLARGGHVDLVAGTDASGLQWLAIDAAGRWDGSPGCSALAAAVRGSECWNIDQFASVSNRPDLVMRSLGQEDSRLLGFYKSVAERRASRDSAGGATAQLPPSARILRAERKGDAIDIELECEAGSGPLSRYRVFVDGCPANGVLGAALAGPGKVKALIAAPLRPVLLEVSCEDASGLASLRASYRLPGQAEAVGGLWYLGFGVSAYRDPRLDLGFAAKDAVDLAKAMEAAGKGFSFVRSRVWTDLKCVKDSFVEAAQMLKGAKPEDTVVLFIAGHGVHDLDAAATYYFLGWEADVGRLPATCASFATIEAILADCAADRKLFLMDTCESGELDGATPPLSGAVTGASSRGLRVSGVDGRAGAAPPPWLYERDRYVYNDLSRRSGAVVFSSCRGDELSWEFAADRNGVFTEAILAALRGDADADGDSRVNTTELRSFVAERVARRTSSDDRPAGAQHPVVDRDNLEARFSFPLPTKTR
jgi:WD40 repeat protein/uncharacterized caspase-like protein